LIWWIVAALVVLAAGALLWRRHRRNSEEPWQWFDTEFGRHQVRGCGCQEDVERAYEILRDQPSGQRLDLRKQR
jgi:hypothetical protein